METGGVSMCMDSTRLQWLMGASPLKTFKQAGTDIQHVHWKLSTEQWGYFHHNSKDLLGSTSNQTGLKAI